MIHPDIRLASTLPGSFYHDSGLFEETKEKIFARSWQLISGAEEQNRLPRMAFPFTYMPNFIDEPLLLLRDDHNEQRCMSNVCTHRGKILVEHQGLLDKSIICGYHGRRFGLDGQFLSMPESDTIVNFPCLDDHLAVLPLGRWRQFVFTSLDPMFPFEELVAEMEAKIGFLPLEQFQFSPAHSRDYLVKINWALYCDNYLEGFHIPFVHKELARSLDWNQYRTELYPWSVCQVGIGRGGDHNFQLPADHPDAGQSISAYYFWLFPNIMFNFYPWGLSLNIVRPLQTRLTKISFRSYVWDERYLGAGAGADVDTIEREDENVLEQVQMGTRSRFYQHGRFSPSHETGVHHFHRMLAARM